MNIQAAGQAGPVIDVARAEPIVVAQAEPAVVGLAPLSLPTPSAALVMPRAGVSAARPALFAPTEGLRDIALIDEARAHFVRERPGVVGALRRANPELSVAVVDEIADEWVARSTSRYSAHLEGRNDGLRALTPSGLLLTIAYEARRPAEDPVRVLAEAHLAKLVEQSSRSGLSPEEAAFQARTIGALLSRSTAGWEAELRRRAP